MKDKRNRHGAVGKSSWEQHFRKSRAITFIGVVGDRTSILYRTRMVHTIRVRYDRTRMVWLFVPYAYSYYSNYTTIAVHKQHKYIGIVNTVLLFFLDHELYP